VVCVVLRSSVLAVAALAFLGAAACSHRNPPGGQASAPTSTSGISGVEAGAARAEAPGGSASGPSTLVPYQADSAWAGHGPPPTAYSIFAVPEASPAPGYASLDRDTCEAELLSRHVDFARAEDTPGVRAPVRLKGLLHGVSIHSALPAAMRPRSRAELIDCRLALSLDDFAAAIAERGITEVVTLSAYRTRAEFGCTYKYDGEQHCAALAVDVGSFKRRNGTVLDVERDFHGRIGMLTCRGAAHPAPETPAASELWDIACTAAGKNFLVVLTPNWNAEHRNHLHLELTTHDWVLVR
jgi:hypothetical protein